MVRRRHKRRQLSCLPCREHKLKCDHGLPCNSCVRHQWTARCLQNPASGAQLAQPQTVSLRRSPAMTTSLNERSGSPGIGVRCQVNDRIKIVESNNHKTAPISMLFDSAMEVPLLRNGLSGSAGFWRAQLLGLLPRKNHFDKLMDFFWENLNCVYAALHEPTTREQYGRLWKPGTGEIDFIWLALIFAMLSVSEIHIPKAIAPPMSLGDIPIHTQAQTWYHASRQALFCGGFEKKAHLAQISAFVITQLYWLALNDSETLNSCLGQTIRNAQALRLDKDDTGYSVSETQLRRRLWWELWETDTFQSLCNGRSPLIHTKPTKVPLPANCDDIKVDETRMDIQPIDQPTASSSSIWRAKAFQIFRRLFADDGDLMSSWEYVRHLDNEIQQLVDNEFPWFFQQSTWVSNSPAATQLNLERPHIVWQHYILHSSIRMQRLRMLRPFMGIEPEAYERSIQQATESLDSYKYLRDHHALRHNPKFKITAYQAFSSAVQLAGLLIVERSPPKHFRDDVQMVLEDLKNNTLDLTIAQDAARLLDKLLQIYDSRQLGAEGILSTEKVNTPEIIAHDLGSVFGGETTARQYFSRPRGQALQTPGSGDKDVICSLDALMADEMDTFFDFFDFENPFALSNIETLERWDPTPNS